MVGVAGRSKGCLTCRRRKKGCDQRRPVCMQCILGNRICGGYGHAIQIVEWKASDAVDEKDRTKTVNSSSIGSRKNPISDVTPENATAIITTVASKHTPSAYAELNMLLSPLIPSLLQNSLQTHLLASLWTAQLPPASLALSPFAELTTLAGWYEFLPSYLPEDPALRSAMLALSLAKLGTGDRKVEVLGRRVYGRALVEIGRALQKGGERSMGEEILCACSMMALYEFFQASAVIPPGDSRQGYSIRHNWMQHTQGLAVLVEARGPERHITGLGHRLLRGIRLSNVIHALQSRRATFFALPAWTTIPWTQHPKNLRDLLVDHLAALPDLVERFDVARGIPRPGSSRPPRSADPESDLRSLIEDLLNLSHTIQSWHNDLTLFIRHTSPTLSWPGTLLSAPLTAPPELYGLAHLTIVYWAACTILYTTLRQAVARWTALTSLKSHADDGLDAADTILASSDSRPGIYAANIVTACPYYFRKELGLTVASNASFSVSVALLYFGATADRKGWNGLVELLRGLKKEGRLLGFLDGVLVDLESEGEGEKGGVSRMAERWWGEGIAEEDC